MTWLNHAGTSWPKPKPVADAIAAATTADPSGWSEAFEAQHRAIAAHLGIADPSRLLPTPGCTSALNVAVADHPWEAGDRIAIGAFEHHALHRPCLKLADRGVETVVCRDLEALERTLRDGRVRLVATAAAANTTGAIAPGREWIALAHEHGALALIDAAQVAGWWPDLGALGADLLAFAGHKGPQAPWGIGGLVVAPHVRMQSPAATCDPVPEGAVAACALMPGYCDVGSVDRIALAGLAAGLDHLATTDAEERLERARARVERLVQAALDRGYTLHGPRDPSARMPIAALTHPEKSPVEIGAALARAGVHVSAGYQCAPLAHRTLGTEAGGIVRFSAGPQTTWDEIDHASSLLPTI